MTNTKSPSSETRLVLVEYAFCCPGSVRYCDCVNKNHGTAVMGENEAGEDYPIVGPAPTSRLVPLTKTQIETLANNIHNVDEYGYTVECLTHHLSGDGVSPPANPHIDRLRDELLSAACLFETLSEDLPEDDVNGVMMRTMAARNRAALAAPDANPRVEGSE